MVIKRDLLNCGVWCARYQRGEEVLFRMGDAVAFQLEGGGQLLGACVPDWTIGMIVAHGRNRHDVYLVSFEHDGNTCFCWIDESAIDGIA